MALKETLAVVLASPMFLYLAEPAVEEKSRSLTAEELASTVAHQVYDRLGWSRRWRAELDPRRLVRPTRRRLSGS